MMPPSSPRIGGEAVIATAIHELQEASIRLAARRQYYGSSTLRTCRRRQSPGGIVERALALADAIVTGAGGELNVSSDPFGL
jgi:hypothetical protein